MRQEVAFFEKNSSGGLVSRRGERRPTSKRSKVVADTEHLSLARRCREFLKEAWLISTEKAKLPWDAG